jgi:4-aminobutyrate aminotransferase-like enzyme
LHHATPCFCNKIISASLLQCVYFVNSGSEANDMAMTLARTHTGTIATINHFAPDLLLHANTADADQCVGCPAGNWDMIVLRNAYHGMSIATMGTCGQHTWKQPMPQVGHCSWRGLAFLCVAIISWVYPMYRLPLHACFPPGLWRAPCLKS